MLIRLDTITAAGPLPEVPGTGPVRLAAMAKPPAWVRALTHGRPDHGFATPEIVPLMDAAIEERAAPLFAAPGRPAYARYADAMAVLLLRLRVEGALAPGALGWHTHDGGMRFGNDGYPNGRLPGHRARGAIPAGAWLLCTCKPGTGCHLTILAPYLAGVGWEVELYGRPFRSDEACATTLQRRPTNGVETP